MHYALSVTWDANRPSVGRGVSRFGDDLGPSWLSQCTVWLPRYKIQRNFVNLVTRLTSARQLVKDSYVRLTSHLCFENIGREFAISGQWIGSSKGMKGQNKLWVILICILPLLCSWFRINMSEWITGSMIYVCQYRPMWNVWPQAITCNKWMNLTPRLLFLEEWTLGSV